MSQIRLLHLSGPRQGEVDVLDKLPASIGSEPDQDVVVPGVAPRHALVFQDDDDIVLRDTGSGRGTYLIGEPVRVAVLRDGDVLELGSGGPKLRVQHRGSAAAALRTRSRNWTSAVPLPRHGPLAALRSLVAHMSLAVRAALLLALMATSGLLAWSYKEGRRLQGEVARLGRAIRTAEIEQGEFQARVEEERHRSDDDRRALASRIEASRQREEALRAKLADATSGEVQSLRSELQAAHDRLATLEGERAVGERIIKDYGAGVCLIQGSWAFYDKQDRPLRYKVDENGRNVKEADGSLALNVDATGEIHTIDYYGTGFLADRSGLILSNRHVAEPWWKDETAQNLAKEGYEARFVRFRAFFPRSSEPLPLDVVKISDKVDLAVLRVRLGGLKVPALPLDATGKGAVAGQPVVVVGYPTGLEAILAKADSGEVQQILDDAGTDSEKVTEVLSQRGLIRPSTTQGHIGDVTTTDIVFDAPTTQGGSGGPVFNKAGQVIAVEYAVLPKFGGNSFGLPIHYALSLLKETRKKERAAD